MGRRTGRSQVPASPISGRAIITGPGLEAPIVVKGTAKFSSAPDDELAVLLRRAGLSQHVGVPDGYHTLPPDEASLGPRYEIRYVFEFENPLSVPRSVRAFYRQVAEATSVPLVQDLYPYAPDRPLFHPHPDQQLFGQRVPPSWWMAPRSTLDSWSTSGSPPRPPPRRPRRPGPSGRSRVP